MTYRSDRVWTFFCERQAGHGLFVWTMAGYVPEAYSITLRGHPAFLGFALVLQGVRYRAVWRFCKDELARGHCKSISANFFCHEPLSSKIILGARVLGDGYMLASDELPYSNTGVEDLKFAHLSLEWEDDDREIARSKFGFRSQR